MADEKKQILSDAVYDNALAAAQSGTRPTYAGSFENQLNDIYNKIENREKFSYDVNADPLYNAYKDKYVQQGKMAMQDTMGKAAALTGGYGSSYGQQVGQQTYNAYLQNLSDVIPQLYGMAQQQYESEGNRLKDLYSLTANQRDTEYNRYQNELSEFNYNQELARQQEQKDYERQVYAENLAYQKQQDARSNVLAMLQLGATPTDAELAAAGITRAQADAIHNQLFPVATGGGGGGYYGGGGTSQPKTLASALSTAAKTALAATQAKQAAGKLKVSGGSGGSGRKG